MSREKGMEIRTIEGRSTINYFIILYTRGLKHAGRMWPVISVCAARDIIKIT